MLLILDCVVCAWSIRFMRHSSIPSLSMQYHDPETQRLLTSDLYESDFDVISIEQSTSDDLSCLGLDCLRLCVEFVSSKSDFESLELSSKPLFRICNQQLQSRHFALLFNQTELSVFRQWQDIRTRAKMIPDSMYLDLNLTESGHHLLGLHVNHSMSFLRGFDERSKLPFLSIQLVNDKRSDERMLLICIFNTQQFENVFIYHRAGMHIMPNGSFGIDELDIIFRGRRWQSKSFEKESRWVSFYSFNSCGARCRKMVTPPIITFLITLVGLSFYFAMLCSINQ